MFSGPVLRQLNWCVLRLLLTRIFRDARNKPGDPGLLRKKLCLRECDPVSKSTFPEGVSPEIKGRYLVNGDRSHSVGNEVHSQSQQGLLSSLTRTPRGAALRIGPVPRHFRAEDGP
jgi:hypothetical protein